MTWTAASAALDFGIIAAWTTSDAPLTITFSGTTDKTTSVSTTGAFSVSPSTIVAGATSQALTVTFHAQSTGRCTGELTVRHGDGAAEVTVILAAEVEPAADDNVVKHALLEVPDYGDTTYVNPQPGIDSTQLKSFLRLGKFDYNREPAQAQELLKLIPQVTSATNPNTPAAASQLIPTSVDSTFPAGTIFADDIRQRPQDKGLSVADDPDHKLTLASREEESGRLYSRGGWRDHSDGNRISTTYGDKVEVVRGNYKMIVMGRQDNPAQAMGWDTGGAHIQDYAPGTMPGASFWLEWIDDPRYHAPDFATDSAGEVTVTAGAASLASEGASQKGVWLLVNTTENVYEYARNAGNFREEVWGDVNEAYVGSENPPSTGTFATNDSDGTQGHEVPYRIPGRNYDFPGTSGNDARATPPWDKDNIGMVRSNPHIIEKTWAVRIDSYTGTEACPVPKIYEHTFADKTYSYTGSSSKPIAYAEEKTHVTKSYALTMAKNIDEVTRAITTTNMTTVAGMIAEFTAASTIFEATVCGVHAEAEVCAIGHIGIELSTLVLDVFAGFKCEVSTASTTEISLDKKGFHVNEDEKQINKIEASLKANEVQIKKTQAAVKNTAAALEHNIAGVKVQLGLG